MSGLIGFIVFACAMVGAVSAGGDADGFDLHVRRKRPKYPSLPGLVACEADQYVPFQESTRWQGPPTPSSMRFGAIVFAANRRAV
jgi:hypothetical protein